MHRTPSLAEHCSWTRGLAPNPFLLLAGLRARLQMKAPRDQEHKKDCGKTLGRYRLPQPAFSNSSQRTGASQPAEDEHRAHRPVLLTMQMQDGSITACWR